MKKNYNFTIQLRCPVCGSTDIEITDDKSFGKCNKCNKEEIQKDFEKEVHDMFKTAFKGNKYIKFK